MTTFYSVCVRHWELLLETGYRYLGWVFKYIAPIALSWTCRFYRSSTVPLITSVPSQGIQRLPQPQTSKDLQKHVYLFKSINLPASGHHLWATFTPHWTQRIFPGVCGLHDTVLMEWCHLPHCFQTLTYKFECFSNS